MVLGVPILKHFRVLSIKNTGDLVVNLCGKRLNLF